MRYKRLFLIPVLALATLTLAGCGATSGSLTRGFAEQQLGEMLIDSIAIERHVELTCDEPGWCFMDYPFKSGADSIEQVESRNKDRQKFDSMFARLGMFTDCTPHPRLGVVVREPYRCNTDWKLASHLTDNGHLIFGKIKKIEVTGISSDSESTAEVEARIPVSVAPPFVPMYGDTPSVTVAFQFRHYDDGWRVDSAYHPTVRSLSDTMTSDFSFEKGGKTLLINEL